jgi:hypothetical protein
VLAYFGYPRASELDAERAVRAGLALVEAVPKLATAAGSPLQVRVGIATGLVVVGDLIGTGAAQEQAVVGDTPNLAARLQSLAEPGTVVISATTRKLTAGLFEYRDLGSVTLKGFGENVPAWQVTGLGAAESRFEALRATSTPMVGRDEEIDLLMRRWGQAKAGDGQVVLICGEPGIGKSRITQTIVERISGDPHTRLRYFCSPHHQDSALYPSIAQLERAVGFRREDTREERLQKLEAVLAQGTNDLTEAVPLLADLLFIPTGGRYPPLNLTPQKRKEKTLYAQLNQVEGLTARQPVLMIWEDIHWSDPTTRESLDLLVDRAAALRILVVITFRPEFTPPWIGRPHVTLLTLSRLAPRQRAQMIGYVTGGKSLPKEIADQIVDRTDGVPLFIEELTKTVIESGVVTEAGDRYAIAGPVTPLAIPTSLHASLLARLDRLAPTREIAQIGAVLGRSFSHELISAVAQLPPQKLDEALAQLVSAELIFRRGTPPDAEYTFKHALVQDAAYGTLLRSRRQQIHMRVVSVIEHQFQISVASQPELLARHCTEAGLTEKAIDYWLAAARQAWSRSMVGETVSLLRHGLALIPAEIATSWGQARELELQIALSQALMANKGWGAEGVSETYARARQLAAMLNRPRELLFASQGEFQYQISRSNLMRARELAAELCSRGEESGDVPTRVLGYDASAYACSLLGELTAARDYVEKGISKFDPAHRHIYADLLPNDMLVQLLCHATVPLAFLGYIDQALLRRDELITEARKHSPFHLACALSFAWLTSWYIRVETKLLSEYADELFAVTAERELGYFRAAACIYRGWVLSAVGHADEGIGLLTTGIAGTYELGFKSWLPVRLMPLADACLMSEQWQAALNHLCEAERLAHETQERWVLAETLRLRGEALVRTGNSAAAEASYVNALTVAGHQSAKLFELRAATSLARLWRDQGKHAEGHDLLAPVYKWFTEGFDTPVLKEAKALLDELSGSHSETPVLSSVPSRSSPVPTT